ncbi:hypothetical protein [Flavobacterium succinicans]|uniref:Uncharacterized protein n=1 Tax=Flavobacterium succinicans TaxID=29536 RepID=A0A199XPH6_9FLAO|nr:hypothetical protein [Flavobacterium succinicans]OAZ03643.1 hypothetical protein FLB_19200 [Flavobacterium succinicans]
MISEKEKDQIFKEMVFEKGLFYFSDTNKNRIKQAYQKLENDFENKEDFIRAVNSLLHANGLHFYSKLRTLTNQSEFIEYIQNQYNLYNEYTPNNSFNWLNFTKKAIMYGFGILQIENTDLKASFINWYNEALKKLEELRILTELKNSNSEKVKDAFQNFSLIKKVSIKDYYQPIVLSLKEYELLYESRLSNHLKIHIDYDTSHFILDEKNNYEFYFNLINSIKCIPDDLLHKKNKFQVININDFDYGNLYFAEGTIDDFFYVSEENENGYVAVEEVRPDVMYVINLFKNLSFDEFVFNSHNLKNSIRLILKFLKKKAKEKNLNKIKPQTDLRVSIEQPQQDNEIDIYLESYNENHFDEVMIKRNEDGTPNNIYLGNNFNEWFKNIDRNLLANKSYDAETQDKLSTYNKYLLFLAQDLMGLFKAVSGYKKTNNAGFKTSIHIQENEILRRLDSIKYYSEIVKHYIRNKQFQKANDIKDYCISLFGNCVYNLNDVLTIDIYKSPLKSHFENVKNDLEKAIDFKELALINELETKAVKQETNILLKLNLQIDYFYKRLCLVNNLKIKEIFLVCSDEPLFDIEKLKQYFLENSLNDFAKIEAKKLIEIIDSFEIKRNEYLLIPKPNPLIFYQYEYVNSKGGKSSGSVSAKLEYFHYTDNKISHLLEIGFKNRSKNSEYIESLKVDKIYSKCIEIREVCKSIIQPQQTENNIPNEAKQKKISEKWYALLYWIELNANGEQPPKNIEGAFIRNEIEKIGSNKTNTTGQSFYRHFIDIDLNNEKSINVSFGKDWKDKIKELSNYNQAVVSFIEKKYSSN